MAESKNNFLKSKMNKDMDNRLVPAGEYRDAVNLNTSRSEGSNVGTVENLLGNNLTYLTKLYGGDSNTITIGVLPDEKNNRIFWFVTNFTDTTAIPKAPYANSRCAILMQKEGITTQPTVLVQGHFLNFSKNYLITGVNLVEDLLFWTDNFNQPRRINVEAILAGERTYVTEEQLSIIRYSPYLAPKVENLFKRTSNGNVNDYLLDKFIRLSYRYKFKDNEYSIIAPFTQILFVPRENGKLTDADKTKIIHTALASSMINDLASVKISVQMPSSNMPLYYHASGIEILLKGSDSTAIKVIDYIDFSRVDFASLYTTYTNSEASSVFVYTYNGSKPYKTLPENQYSRTYDNVPVKAMAQEVAGGRIIYGNYVQNKKLPVLNYSITVNQKPNDVAGTTLIDINGVNTGGKYPQHSLKQKRPYSVGVILSDVFGRQSSVILPINAKDAFVYAPYLSSLGGYTETNLWNGNCLSINFSAPSGDALSSAVVSSPYSTKVALLVCDTAVVSNNVLTLTSSASLLATGITNGLIVGQYLKGRYTENTEILTLSQTGAVGSYTTIVTCKLPISNILYTTALAGTLFKYIININGWHSYKIVVKQAEQDYYNVYNMRGIAITPAADSTSKSYLSLHGDNMNKIPRTSMPVNRDSGITVSKEKIYSKVTAGLSNKSIQQSSNNKEAINILSIGSTTEYALYVDPLATPLVVSPSIYESTKNHLQIEIYDPSKEFGITAGSASIIPILTVYETKPLVSNLDIYWETSTSGLVDEINYLLTSEQENGETLPSVFYFSNLEGSTPANIFSESIPSLDLIPDLKIKYQSGNFTVVNIEIDNLYNFGNSIYTSPLNYLTIVFLGGNYRIRLSKPYRYNGIGATEQTFKFAIKVTTQNPSDLGDTRIHYFGFGYSAFEDVAGLTLDLSNVAPSFTDTTGAFNYVGNPSSTSTQSLGTIVKSAINGSAFTGFTTDDLVYSILSVERFTNDIYAYDTNYGGVNTYPNWNNYTGVPTSLPTGGITSFGISTSGTTEKKGYIFKENTANELVTGLIPNARYKITVAVKDANNNPGALQSTEVITYDHNIVTLGTQKWTIKNANISKFRDGTDIPYYNVSDSVWNALTVPGWCYYNNDPSTEEVYGKLYNWYAVTDSKGFAPAGYKVPSESDWANLTTYLGGESVSGSKVRSYTSNWRSGGITGTNVSGFSALGSGYRPAAGFIAKTEAALFWSSSDAGGVNGYNVGLSYATDYFGGGGSNKAGGFSVRFLKTAF